MAITSWKLWAAASAVALSVIGGWYTLWPSNGTASSSLFKANDAAIISTGKRIYAETCASCHGERLEGEENWQTRDPEGFMPAPPHDETGHTWHHKDQLLFDITKFGIKKFAGDDYKTKMPAYEDVLSDDEIIAVLSYIKAQWPEQIRSRHDQLNTITE